MDLNFSQCVLCNVRFMTRFFQRLVAVLPSDYRREDAGRTVPQGLGEGVVPVLDLWMEELAVRSPVPVPVLRRQVLQRDGLLRSGPPRDTDEPPHQEPRVRLHHLMVLPARQGEQLRQEP